jgi:hypothetical protein
VNLEFKLLLASVLRAMQSNRRLADSPRVRRLRDRMLAVFIPRALEPAYARVPAKFPQALPLKMPLVVHAARLRPRGSHASYGGLSARRGPSWQGMRMTTPFTAVRLFKAAAYASSLLTKCYHFKK